MNIISYKTLNGAKFEVITDVEKGLLIQPFADEWARLDPDGDGKRHRPFHKVEVIVPWVFVAVYVTQALFTLPWRRVVSALCSG